MSLALESERYRAERLEGQINDLTELHQVNLALLLSSRLKSLINWSILIIERNRKSEASYGRYGGKGSVSER